MASVPKRKLRVFVVLSAASVFVLLMLGLIYEAPIPATSSQNTCIGLGGWPCGYTGPYTGVYYVGYATLACTPSTGSGSCVVPQIAIVTSFLVINNAPYVIDWANQTLESNAHIRQGSGISIVGYLAPIIYNKTAGSTYPVYHSNANDTWNPQPQLQIENATIQIDNATNR